MPTSARLQQLQALQLRLQIIRLREENSELRAEVKQDIKLRLDLERMQKLQQEVQQAALNEASLAVELTCCKPDWSGGGGLWSSWKAGIEVVYSVGSAAATTKAGGAEHLVTFSSRPARLQLFSQPFAQGGLRTAYYTRDDAGGRFAVKRAINESSKLRKNQLEAHIHAQTAALCQLAAEQFNGAAGGGDGGSASADGAAAAELCCATLRYLPVSVLILEDDRAPSGKAVYLKEPWLDPGSCGSTWTKWTLNDGNLLPDGAADTVIQAFSYFTLRFGRERLGYDMLVLDAQGMVERSGGRATYTLTDPAICSAPGKHGPTDTGSAALATFFTAHCCVEACQALGCSGMRLA